MDGLCANGVDQPGEMSTLYDHVVAQHQKQPVVVSFVVFRDVNTMDQNLPVEKVDGTMFLCTKGLFLMREYARCPLESVREIPLAVTVNPANGESTVKVYVQSPNKMQLFIKTLTGATRTLTVRPTDTILDVKREIESMESISVDHQRLIHRLIALDNDETLESMGIQKESTLHLITRLTGGMHVVQNGRVDYDGSPVCTIDIQPEGSKKRSMIVRYDWPLKYLVVKARLESGVEYASAVDREELSEYLAFSTNRQ